PYADGSVDAIHCEAVLEHLVDPRLAVTEMFRVCRPGAAVYAATPFMQAYHGYPNHFQNFTLSGHQHLFASAGFQIRESGTAAGPVLALLILILRFIQEYVPRPIRWPMLAAYAVSYYFLVPLDRFVNVRPNAYLMASSTYLVAEKPLAPAAD
ncbi:MAG: methyltransferase domain-containing protein, partial [Solirubrobacteraceae bacterium]